MYFVLLGLWIIICGLGYYDIFFLLILGFKLLSSNLGFIIIDWLFSLYIIVVFL